MLAFARGAEYTAKTQIKGKDVLVIDYRPRGGAAIELRSSWSEGPDARLREWADLLRADLLPDKVAYDLRKLARAYSRAGDAEADEPAWDDPEALATALRADAARLMSRKAPSARAVIEAHLDGVTTGRDLTELAETILIARRLADALDQAGEPAPVPAPIAREQEARG